MNFFLEQESEDDAEDQHQDLGDQGGDGGGEEQVPVLSPTTAGNHMAVREAFNLKNPSDCSTDSVLVSSFCRLRGLLSSLCPSSTSFGFPLVKN